MTKKINKHHLLSDSDDEVQIKSSNKNDKAKDQLVKDIQNVSHIKKEPPNTISPAEMFSKTSVTRETISRVKKKPKTRVNLYCITKACKMMPL